MVVFTFPILCQVQGHQYSLHFSKNSTPKHCIIVRWHSYIQNCIQLTHSTTTLTWSMGETKNRRWLLHMNIESLVCKIEVAKANNVKLRITKHIMCTHVHTGTELKWSEHNSSHFCWIAECVLLLKENRTSEDE